MRKRVFGIVSWLVVTLSLGFISYTVYSQKDAITQWNPSVEMVLLALSASVIYAIANTLLSNNWFRLLAALDEQPLNRSQHRKIYANSQIAKYLPGNVMHVAGRHVLCKELGLLHSTIALSALLEMAGLCVASLLMAMIGGSYLSGLSIFPYDQVLISAALLLLTAVYIGSPRIAPLMMSKIVWSDKLPSKRTYLELIKNLFYYLLFFTMAGSALLIVVVSLTDELSTSNVLIVLVCFSVSWLVGFIAPGAPSGIGVRESIIVLLLTGVIGAGPALITSIVFRLVTILGDVLFLVVAGGKYSDYGGSKGSLN